MIALLITVHSIIQIDIPKAYLDTETQEQLSEFRIQHEMTFSISH